MLSETKQRTLTQVGPGTPMGELLRRYWIPLAASSTIPIGEATRIRLLGENLVMYRDLQGRPALVDEACPHRGTSLALGCVDRDGIRCPYHGWKFDGTGQCLETPAEPEDSVLRQRVRTRAYPVQEIVGMAFAYLGPPERQPLLPRYDVFLKEPALRDIGHAVLPCNWVQIMENSVDPHHLEWLHGHHLAHSRERTGQKAPTHYRKKHERVGFDVFEYGIIKRRILEGGSEEDDDWKVGHPLVFPFTLRVGAGRQHRLQFRVPIDDTSTRHFWYACYEPAPGKTAPKQDVIPQYEVQWRDDDGEFIVDFVDGGDIMAVVTQGPIADRTREILGASDQGIALYRKLLFEQAERVQSGEDPIGLIYDPKRNEVVELPQEREKYRAGGSFLRESIEMGHARYSPLKEQIIEMLEPAASTLAPEMKPTVRQPVL